VCHSYSDLNFGVTFFRTQCIITFLNCCTTLTDRYVGPIISLLCKRYHWSYEFHIIFIALK